MLKRLNQEQFANALRIARSVMDGSIHPTPTSEGPMIEHNAALRIAQALVQVCDGGQTTATRKFRVGDIVRLKPGGPLMVIAAVSLTEKTAGRVKCAWVSEAGFMQQCEMSEDLVVQVRSETRTSDSSLPLSCFVCGVTVGLLSRLSDKNFYCEECATLGVYQCDTEPLAPSPSTFDQSNG